MTRDSENGDQEPVFDLDNLRMMEEAMIRSYIDDEAPDFHDESEIEHEVFSEEDMTDIDDRFLKNQAEIKKVQSAAHLVMNYFVLASTLIEPMSINLLKNELIVEEYSGTKKTNNMFEHRLDQELREDLLLRTGIIDESLKSEMSHIRSIRNGLVHDFTNYLFLEVVDSVPSELDRVYETYSQLLNIVTEGDTISLKVEMDGE